MTSTAIEKQKPDINTVVRIAMDLATPPAEPNDLDEIEGEFPAENGTDGKPLILPKMWAVYGKTYSPCEKAVTYLPAGHYLIKSNSERGVYFAEKTVNVDELLTLPDSTSEDILKNIQNFWTKEEKYRQMKFLWKRGILLWGPPGGGKTSTVQMVADAIVKKNGLAIYVQNPGLAVVGLGDILRYIEPKRPIVVILEDIDAICERWGESELLALLDGEFQIDNAVYIATTNYPEKLDKRIRNRPSRFDVVTKIGMPGEESRKMYLEIKNPRLKDQPEELAKWVEETHDFSIAHIKELIVAVECLEHDFEECVGRLKDMIESEISSAQAERYVGLGFVKASQKKAMA